MINLMYLVFIAMMAMNDTSSEVLSGFELVEKSLRESAARRWRNWRPPIG